MASGGKRGAAPDDIPITILADTYGVSADEIERRWSARSVNRILMLWEARGMIPDIEKATKDDDEKSTRTQRRPKPRKR